MLETQVYSNAQENTLLNHITQLNFGDIHIKHCAQTQLTAIIAIHNTTLGPALGGVRCVRYSNFTEAFVDALHLAKGMSFKAAISNLPHGGGKAVILKPEVIKDRKAFFTQFGRFIDELGGRYITAEDSGVSIEDMDTIKKVTPYVSGFSDSNYDFHDPSPLTALGVRRGIEAAVEFHLGKPNLEGIHVAIKGVGKVGSHLAQELNQLGAQVTVADINPVATEKLQSKVHCRVVSIDEIHKVECDVYAPCALSFSLTEQIVSQMRAPIIAGAANNQLAHPNMGKFIQDLGKLYAPDYAINAGGLIHVSAQYARSSEREARDKVESIYNTMMEIFNKAKQLNLPTNEVADDLALQKFS